MNEFLIAFIVGLCIGFIWLLFKLYIMIKSSSSFQDFKRLLAERGREAQAKSQAYWNHGMTRRDWFWWGRW